MGITSPELYGMSRGARCEGMFRCHWCGAACGQMWKHDDVTLGLMFGPKSKQAPVIPASPFICAGCWLFRQKSITAFFLTPHGGTAFKDRQNPSTHSWWITDGDSRAITAHCHADLVHLLLNPPRRFSLSFLAGEQKPQNMLHRCPCNDEAILTKDTPLGFAVNNTAYTYTVYELEQAPKLGSNGLSAGTRALCDLIGMPNLIDPKPEEKKSGPKGGRPPAPTEPPPDGRIVKKVLAVSGAPVGAR